MCIFVGSFFLDLEFPCKDFSEVQGTVSFVDNYRGNLHVASR